MDTLAFKTRTKFEPRENPHTSKSWGIAIDVGYSGVKTFAPNMVAVFPAFAKKLTKGEEFLGEAGRNEILYEDENGERWAVGEKAQNMISDNDATSSLSGLFIRDRFESPMFKVIARTGLATGMTANQFGSPAGKTLVVQTGLPPRHMKEYEQSLKEALSGHHHFRIKIENNDWQTLDFDLPATNIFVMSQPKGSFTSVSVDKNGNAVANAKQFLNANVLVLDPGFGTADTFNLKERRIINSCTWEDLGMRAVLEGTCKDIYDKFGTEITIPAMQKALKDGTVKVRNRKDRSVKRESFADLLEQNSNRICEELLRTVDETYDGLFDHDYLIVTGGLGSAWISQIKKHYEGNEELKIISGNVNDTTLAGIYSNVRGYYMQLLSTIKKAEKAEA